MGTFIEWLGTLWETPKSAFQNEAMCCILEHSDYFTTKVTF